MIKKISRKKFLARYPDFATADYRTDKYSFPTTCNNYILAVDHKSTRGLNKNISEALLKLSKLLGYNSLFFLGDTTTPWLYRQHDYPPVRLALQYLAGNNISKSFNGAIQVGSEHLTEFSKHLFWLVRCNGVVMTPHFSDEDFNLIGSMCQYGNLHISTLNKCTDNKLKEVLNQTGFFEVDDCGGGKIAGRTATFI